MQESIGSNLRQSDVPGGAGGVRPGVKVRRGEAGCFVWRWEGRCRGSGCGELQDDYDPLKVMSGGCGGDGGDWPREADFGRVPMLGHAAEVGKVLMSGETLLEFSLSLPVDEVVELIVA